MGLGVVALEVDLGYQGIKGQLSPQMLPFHFKALLTPNCEGKS